MENSFIKLEHAAIAELSTDFTIGRLQHGTMSSWAPTQTPTHQEDRFFEVAMQAPTELKV